MEKTESETILQFAQQHLDAKTVEVTDDKGRKAQVLVTPRGDVVGVKPFLDAYATAPERRVGTAKMFDLDSLIEHITRFADDSSVLFANPDRAAPSILAVLDYNHKGATSEPRFGCHRAHYAFPISDEWKAWNEKHGVRFTQKDFAEFIENRVADLAVPRDTAGAIMDLAEKLGGDIASPQKLIELSKGLAVREGAAVKGAVNLSSGEAQISYVTQHADEDGKPLKVPNLFLIQIPVFRSGAPYEMAVRLRYRVQSGAIAWFFELYRADKVFDHAFTEACDDAAAKTGLPLFVGAPES